MVELWSRISSSAAGRPANEGDGILRMGGVRLNIASSFEATMDGICGVYGAGDRSGCPAAA
jgi:hypothetical protein